MTREALARRKASIMMNSSIKCWLLGGLDDCTTNTSSPRTFSSILTNVSPSGNCETSHRPNSMPIDRQMASANGRFELPLKIFTCQTRPRRKKGRQSNARAQQRKPNLSGQRNHPPAERPRPTGGCQPE